MQKSLAPALILLLVGCASNSGVTSIGKDTYMVSRQAATGFSGSGNLKAEAFREASEHCERMGKSLQVVSTHEATPPYVFGNFPKAEVQYMCLASGDVDLNRPKLKKVADTTIEVKSETRIKTEPAMSSDYYAELVKLDDLRKRGIITDVEFDTQKKKLLGKN